MTKIVKGIFGGKDSSAQKGQAAQNAAATDFIKTQGAQARSDLLSLAPAAENSRNLGYQGALDVLGQTIPGQINAFTSGNAAAQAAILGGDPTINTISPNTSFSSQQLPQYQTIAEALTGGSFETKNKLANIKTDADLLMAAANGDIPGLSSADRQWYGQLLQQTPGFAQTSNYISDPAGAISSVTGNGSGLNAQNQLRMRDLLTKYNTLSQPMRSENMFGSGNASISAGDISNFLSNPNLTPEQILSKMNSSGVSLSQLQAVAPNDPRFTNESVMPYLSSKGYTR